MIGPDINSIRALAEFRAELEASDFVAGEVKPSRLGAEGTERIPHTELCCVVRRFESMLYESNWIIPFDWVAWKSTDRARQLFSEENALETTDLEDLARMLTVCIRQDRFISGGGLIDHFNSGLMLRIVRRANVLTDELRDMRWLGGRNG